MWTESCAWKSQLSKLRMLEGVCVTTLDSPDGASNPSLPLQEGAYIKDDTVCSCGHEKLGLGPGWSCGPRLVVYFFPSFFFLSTLMLNWELGANSSLKELSGRLL